MAPAKTWVVVGASRGLGHEFVRQLLARGDNVVATVRHLDIDAKPWQDESRCHVYECDMLSASSIEVNERPAGPRNPKHSLQCRLIVIGIFSAARPRSYPHRPSRPECRGLEVSQSSYRALVR